jgi:hypothetical protein
MLLSQSGDEIIFNHHFDLHPPLSQSLKFVRYSYIMEYLLRTQKYKIVKHYVRNIQSP